MIYFSKEVRIQLTMALLVLLAGACSATQMRAVHDTLDGVHAICEGADPALHLVLEKTASPGATADGGGD
jgi:hypothetical protein